MRHTYWLYITCESSVATRQLALAAQRQVLPVILSSCAMSSIFIAAISFRPSFPSRTVTAHSHFYGKFYG